MTEGGPTVCIIGAGFSGTSLAVHLLRLRSPIRVVLVNRFGPIGRGVAYGTRFEALEILTVKPARDETPGVEPRVVLEARTLDPLPVGARSSAISIIVSPVGR